MDTDGLLEHSLRGGSLYYRGPVLQKVTRVFSESPFIASIINTVSYWLMERHTDRWDKVEKPGIDSHPNGPRTPDEGGRAAL